MEESKRITMKKIAQRAKVSLATVSRVVSGSSSIRPVCARLWKKQCEIWDIHQQNQEKELG